MAKSTKKAELVTTEILDKRLEPIQETLKTFQTTLKTFQVTLEAVQASVTTLEAIQTSVANIEITNKVYADMYKINGDNILKLHQRVSKTEEILDIEVDPDLEIKSFPNQS